MERVTRAIGHNPFTNLAKVATTVLVGLPYLTAVTAWSLFAEKPKEPEPVNRTWMALGFTAMVLAISTMFFCYTRAFSKRNSRQSSFQLRFPLPSSSFSSSSRSTSPRPSEIDVSQSLKPEFLLSQVQKEKNPVVWLQALQGSIANFNKALSELEEACGQDKDIIARVLLGQKVENISLPENVHPREMLNNILHLYFIYRRSYAPELGEKLFAKEHRVVTAEERSQYLGFSAEHLFATLFLDPVLLAKKPLSTKELCFYDGNTPQGQMREAYNAFLARHGALLHQMYLREPGGSQAWHMCPWLVQDFNTAAGYTKFFADRQYYLDRWPTLKI